VNLAGPPESIQMVCLNFEQGGFYCRGLGQHKPMIRPA
jgi:hypothetical protein